MACVTVLMFPIYKGMSEARYVVMCVFGKRELAILLYIRLWYGTGW